MSAIIKKTMLDKFTPEFHTAINGQAVRITLDEAKTNWARYINTPAAVLYENLKELRAKVASKKPTTKPVKLDMNKQQRGKVFDQNKQRQEAIQAFKSKSAKNVARLASSLTPEQKKASDAAKLAAEKAKAKEAKKATKDA